jgi:cyclic beta-1,2-glucan synthetase
MVKFFGPTTDAFNTSSAPIRGELFSAERLEQHAESLAASQRAAIGAASGVKLGPRLAENSQHIIAAYKRISAMIGVGQSIPAAAEWLVDNYHLVDEQVREIKDDLPPGFYRKLPKLTEGHLEGYPRVFGIAWALVAHSDSAVDQARLSAFVDAYQRVSVLTIGELWAVAITLRILLIENLRRLADELTVRLDAERIAADLGDAIIDSDSTSDREAVFARLAQCPWSEHFAVQLAQRLRDRDPASTPALSWLVGRLAKDGMTIDEVTRREVSRQSATNVTMRNVVTSMRLVSAITWRDWFESVSVIDAHMRADSAFDVMDFESRDYYRRSIEDIAARSRLTEIEVADAALKAGREARRKCGESSREGDPGYYLFAEGRPAFEKAIGSSPSLSARFRRSASAAGIGGYLLVIGTMTVLLVGVAVAALTAATVPGWVTAVFCVCAIFPASEAAAALTNRIVTQEFGAKMLPGLELKTGVPADAGTLVVIPALLTDLPTVEELISRLEIHHLSNNDHAIVFGLLSDWVDAADEAVPGDGALFDAAANGIAALNAKYPALDGATRFHLLHRRRLWNPREGVWMGWERKRGKLHELNRHLRGARDTSFVPFDTMPSLPLNVCHVMTLDADTRLTIGAVRKLVGKLLHPLTRPRFNAAQRRVIAGHGILQPRVTPSLPGSEGSSWFQRAFAGPSGLDPYAFVVSDVYQDLFDDGTFTGKGIYDVDAFEASLAGRIPPDSVLSHDLLEGVFARAGLATDVELVEEFPQRYQVATARQHRWVRGDWQLLPWIAGSIFAPRTGKAAFMPATGRWKMLDNLRRSLVAPMTLFALLIGWTMEHPGAMSATGFLAVLIALPPLVPVFAGLVPRRASASSINHWRAVLRDLRSACGQFALQLVFLAHNAFVMVDAIARTLFRLTVTRRHMLEWVTAAQLTRSRTSDGRAIVLPFMAAVLFSAFVLALIATIHWANWSTVLPFIAMWLASPLVAQLASISRRRRVAAALLPDDAQALRAIALQTWQFFQVFVTPRDNMLPPDNVQEDPALAIAHRTSPTNIGLYGLATVAAVDFGWLTLSSFQASMTALLAGLHRLERYRGHLFNWYDTQTLGTLDPRYVSTVDSGNLAGHLVVLSMAAREYAGREFRACCAAQGFRDLADGLTSATQALSTPPTQELSGLVAALASVAKDLPAYPVTLLDHLATAGVTGASARAAAATLSGDIRTRAEALALWLEEGVAELDEIAPWRSHEAALKGLASPDAVALLEGRFSLQDLPGLCASVRLLCSDPALADALDLSASNATEQLQRLDRIAVDARAFAWGMDFTFLFDKQRQLFSIGYRVDANELDASYYDLLESEARLASYFAIAKGDVSSRHWFHLGRTLAPRGGGACLMSWSGSMFEYLMPSLVMREPEDSLLATSNDFAVRRQQEYGRELGTPWGISESQYNARDFEQTYQYTGFGVPDLGFKRGLGESIVIAPYATGLAAMTDPARAAQNYQRLRMIGAEGQYGFYEAVDFTKTRLPAEAEHVVVKAYMAHHQAMTIVGIGNALSGGVMRRRFHAEPAIEAAELLLQERMPRDVAHAQRPMPARQETPRVSTPLSVVFQRRYTTPASRAPRTQMLSNGQYSVMVTATGAGYSRWKDIAISRWREDVTQDNSGAYLMLRDVRSGEYWSATQQPFAKNADANVVEFFEDHVQIVRQHGAIATTLQIYVSPEDNAEIRYLTIENGGANSREIEVTSFCELALARQNDDAAHPAFSKLFVQTEYDAHFGALIAGRRKRSDRDPDIWAAHSCVTDAPVLGDLQYETDRARFLGRDRTLRNASAIEDGWPLTNTTGAVLDPIFSLRRRVRVPPGGKVSLAFWTFAGPDRQTVAALVDKYSGLAAFERVRTLAWTQSQIQLFHMGIGTDEAHLFQRLGAHVLYSIPTLRPAPSAIAAGGDRQSALWVHGISGDNPIVLVEIESDEDLGLVRQMLRAGDFWALKGLSADLIFVNKRASSYVQDFQDSLERMIRSSRFIPFAPHPGVRSGAFLLRADLLPDKTKAHLLSIARILIRASDGSLAAQVNRARDGIRDIVAPPQLHAAPTPEIPLPLPPLEYFNGLGGFAEQGREYMTVIDGLATTPAPWVNVIANAGFGFHVSASGAGATWAANSQQNRLTSWSNDAVSDTPSEVFYIRDDDTGEVWSATSLPIKEAHATYRVRHGQGYSVFETTSRGILSELTLFVPADDPVKLARLKLSNLSGRPRRLSVTAYAELALGTWRAATAHHIVTGLDPRSGAIFATNPWSLDYGGQVAFFDFAGQQSSWTGDRTEFLGRDSSVASPRALESKGALSNRLGAGLDPCVALQARLRLSLVGSSELTFIMGEASSPAAATDLIVKHRHAATGEALKAVRAEWSRTLETIQIETPDRALDIMMNRWLPYQVLSCRVFARAGFYQSSGAYGYRDQLQDVMALCLARPDLARQHILTAAARQFTEGDVQHWWLAGSGRGIRTRISDDVLWLPFVTAHYVRTTGDATILDEDVAFIEGPVLTPEQHDAFFEPTVSQRTATLMEHCALAIDHSLRTGPHGLPLMGTGDWNDGMDRVGAGGQGESVWLGWFLSAAVRDFAPLAERHGYGERAGHWRKAMLALKNALEQSGWDGDWYRRAYFDDGTPLGSVLSAECRIDSIAQSWSVLSGAGDPARSERAMAAVDRYLVRRSDRMSLLFTPAFADPARDPGYIKGYPAGIRENGGQYTHGAVWAAAAFAMLGDGDRCAELLAMINPINHAASPSEAERYKTEPYVVCADIYANPQHVGRGGWSWYTGSAGWVYRVALEWLLGFRKHGDMLQIDPCIPRTWPSFKIAYRYGTATYRITVENPLGVSRGVLSLSVDGIAARSGNYNVSLEDDGREHLIQVVLG